MQFPIIKSPLKFYAVVPTAQWVKIMLNAGASTIQLRNKELTKLQLNREIKLSVDYVVNSGNQTQLFINDYWQQAIELGAYGVHLGQEDLVKADLVAIKQAGLRLGVSTHSDDELATALALRPSYVACGAIFPTTTKPMTSEPQGLERLQHYVKIAGTTPTVAIGGINLTNATQVLATGVSSLAVVRAVTQAKDPVKVVQQFLKLWN